jgi:hypothetical protein
VAHSAYDGGATVAHRCQANQRLESSVSCGVSPYGIGETRGPIAPTLGKRQVVEAAGVDTAARVELDVIEGDLRWGSDLVFFSYGGGEA